METVSYRLRPTGSTIRVGTADKPTYRVERWTNRLASGPLAPDGFALSGVVANDVTSFVVRAFDTRGNRVTWAGTSGGYGRPSSTNPSNDPVRFEIEIESGARGPARRAGDQVATTEQNVVRAAQSIRPVNAGATGSSTVDGSAAASRTHPASARRAAAAGAAPGAAAENAVALAASPLAAEAADDQLPVPASGPTAEADSS